MNITNHRFILLISSIGLLGTAVSASAQLAAGRGHFESALGLQANYDSNIFLQRNGGSDTSLEFNGSEKYIHDSGILTSNSEISIDYTLFDKHSNQNALDPLFSERLGYAPSDKTTANADLSFQRSSIANPDLNTRTKSNNTACDGMFQHLWSEKLGYRLLGNYNDDNYITPGFSDVLSYMAGIDAVYTYSEKLTFLAGFQHQESWTSHREPGQPDPSSKDAIYTVGAEGELAPKLSGTLNAGVENRRFNSASFDGSSSFYLSTNLKWIASPKTSVALTAASNFDLTAANQSSKIESLTLGETHVLNKQWSVEGAITASRTNYSGLGIGSSRTDDTFTIKSQVSYAWATNVTINASAGYSRVDSSLVLSTYDRVYASLGITATF